MKPLFASLVFMVALAYCSESGLEGGIGDEEMVVLYLEQKYS